MKRNQDRLFLLVLFAANLALIWPFLRTDFGSEPWNNDYIYLGTAKMFRDYPWTWNPLQYGGVPFAYMYQPLFYLWVLAMPVASLGHAYHLASGLGYAMVPLAMFVLARALFQSRAAAAFAAIAYSFLPSFIAFAFPGWLPPEGAAYRFAPWGFTALVAYHEVPHTISLALAMFAVAAACRDRWIPSTFLTAAVFLLNWPGSIGLLIALVALAVARRGEFFRICTLIATAYGLSAFWMTPGFFASIWMLNRVILRHETTQSDAAWPAQAWLILIIGIAFAVVPLGRRIPDSLGFALAFTSISTTVVAGLAFAGAHFLPLSNRYVLEADAGVILIAAWLVSKIPKYRVITVALLVAIGFAAALPFYRQAWPLQGSSIDPRSTVTYQIDQWLNQNAAGQRVFASGEMEGYLNLWTDNPQVGGSHNGISNFLEVAGQKVIVSGCGPNAGELTPLWLRALAAPYAVVHEGASREAFHWIADPQKFAELPVAWTNHQGDTIYRLPDPPVEQSVVINLDQLPQLSRLSSADDLRRYTAWAQGLRAAEVRWTRPDRAEISASLAANEAILLKTNFDGGWHSDQAVLSRDPIGFLIVRPKPGANHVSLHYGASWDVWLGRLLTLATVAMMLMRVRSFMPPVLCVLVAMAAFVVLLSRENPQRDAAERAFRDLHPPMVNFRGFVPGPVSAVYGNDFTAAGTDVRVWIGGNPTKPNFVSPQMITFQWPAGARPREIIQVESSGCRGNTFEVAR